jgi:hypothetical protein
MWRRPGSYMYDPARSIVDRRDRRSTSMRCLEQLQSNATACAFSRPCARRRLSPLVAVEGAYRELGKGGAHERARDHIAWVMHAGVHARVGHCCSKRPQWDGGRRHHGAHAGRKRKCRRGMSRGKRCRDGHSHVAIERHLLGRSIWPTTMAERLDRDVDNGRGSRNRSEPQGGRATSSRPAHQRERRRGGDRQPRIVGGIGESTHEPVKRRSWSTGDCRIERGVDTLDLSHPAATPRRGSISGRGDIGESHCSSSYEATDRPRGHVTSWSETFLAS